MSKKKKTSKGAKILALFMLGALAISIAASIFAYMI